MAKRAADPPKEKKKSTKPLVMIPMDQLQDLGAAAENVEEEELPDLAFDYFQRLEDTFKTFSEGPITIADLQDLVEQSMITSEFTKCCIFIIISKFVSFLLFSQGEGSRTR